MTASFTSEVNRLWQEQLEEWPLLRRNTVALAQCLTRDIKLPSGLSYRVQFNPARAISTGAAVDASSIAQRPCFLCAKNRPKEQRGLDVPQCPEFEILANPYPIFPGHLTIVSRHHKPQLVADAIEPLRQLSALLPGYILFFNGATCGASAPDHLHLQAVPQQYLPLLNTPQKLPFRWFSDLTQATDYDPEQFNILINQSGMVAIPRRIHRPSFYGTDEGQMLVSPAAIDLAGVIITPRREDFEAMNAEIVLELLRQTCYATI